MVEQIVYYMMRFRKQLFVLAVIIVLTMLSLIKVPEIDNRLTGYNVDNNPYDSVGLRMAELFGSKDPVQVKVSPEPTTTLVVFEALELMESELIRAFPGIRIESLHKASSLLFRTVNSDSSVFEMMKVAGKIPVICNLVSRDSLSFLMVAYTDHVTSFDPDVFDRIIHEPYKGIISASAISLSHIQLQTEKSIRRDYTLILPLILLFVMIFIFYSYRSLGAIMFSAINILFSGISVFFFFTVMKVNINQVTATSIAVVVVLSLSVSVHFLTGFFFHKAKLPVANRILMMLRFYLVPVFLTSITTAIAFGSFFLSDSLYVKQFGLVSAASLLTTSILTCFAAPLMLGFIKSRSQKPFLSLTVTRFQAVILRNNRVISIVLILVLGISFFFISKVTFRTNLETFIPLKTPVYKSYQEIRQAFSSLAELDLIVEAGEGMPDSISNSERRRRVVGIVGDLSREISSWPEVASVQSFTDQLDFERRFSVPGFRVTIFPRSKNPFVSKDQNCYRINVKIKDSRDIWKVNSMLSTGFSPYEPVFKCGVYSDFLFFHYISSRVTSSILRSLLLSAVLIFLLIFLLTRSVRITAAAILANMIPIGFLILILAGFRIDLNITTSITLVVCLGLIVDDTIHILYRSVLLKIPLDELSFGVLNTSIILTVGFSLFLLSQSKQIQLFGILNAIVFMIAVISDLAVLSWLLNKHNFDKPDSEDCNYK